MGDERNIYSSEEDKSQGTNLYEVGEQDQDFGKLPEELGFFERAIGVVVSPGAVFADLERRPRILFPLLLAAFGQLVFFLIRFPLYKELMLESSRMNAATQGISMTAEQLQANTDIAVKIGLFALPIMGVIGLALATLIYLVIFKVLKGEGTYKQFFSMLGYAGIIGWLYSLLTTGLSFFTHELYLQLPMDSLAFVLDPNLEGTFLYGMARGIRFFSIWSTVVTAIGVVQITKLNPKKVYIVVGILFLIGLLIGGGSELLTAKLQTLAK